MYQRSLTDPDSFWADLHGGNIMILDDGRIGFIDFGMIGRIPHEKWQAIFKLFMGLTAVNPEMIANAMLRVGMTNNKVSIDDLTRDASELIESFKKVDNDSYLGSAIEAGSIDQGIESMLLNMGQLAKKHGLRFPHSFTLLVKQFLYFDRYTSALGVATNDVFEENILKIRDSL